MTELESHKLLLDKLKNRNIYNISLNVFDYLKDIVDKDNIIVIRNDFDFSAFREYTRADLYFYRELYKKLMDIDSEVITDNRDLYLYIDELLSNDNLLDNYTIFKIQQFINEFVLRIRNSKDENVTKDLMYARNNNNRNVIYKGRNIDLPGYYDTMNPISLSNYLYKEFSINNVKFEDYFQALELKNMDEIKTNEKYLYEINKLLFKAGVDTKAKGALVFKHPSLDNKTVMEYFRENEVPNRIINKR